MGILIDVSIDQKILQPFRNASESASVEFRDVISAYKFKKWQSNNVLEQNV